MEGVRKEMEAEGTIPLTICDAFRKKKELAAKVNFFQTEVSHVQ